MSFLSLLSFGSFAWLLPETDRLAGRLESSDSPRQRAIVKVVK